MLLSDREAEHIPGCNMAFRRDALRGDRRLRPAVPRRRATTSTSAGGCRSAAGRSASARPRWSGTTAATRCAPTGSQQRGYGKAEALLERKWPEKYNPAGHLTWAGRLYGNGSARCLGPRRWRIYYGTWGTRLFQSLYQPAERSCRSLPLMPEYYLLLAALLGLSLAGLLWTPLLAAVPLLVLAVGTLLVDAALGARRASVVRRATSAPARLRKSALVATLYILQPLARLYGRLRLGLSPFRRRGPAGVVAPIPRT